MSFVNYNPNPIGNHVGDCTVRAIAILTGESWDKIYVDLCIEGYLLGDMPSSNSVWGSYLVKRGYKKYLLPTNCPVCYTVKEFAETHRTGKYLLATGTHVVTVISGIILDSWDSSDEQIIYLFKKE